MHKAHVAHAACGPSREQVFLSPQSNHHPDTWSIHFRGFLYSFTS